MKKVTELPAKLKIKVNKTNIRRGVKGVAETCAVARAIRSAIQAKRNNMEVAVGGGNDIDIADTYDTVTYVGSTKREQERIDNFISSFDDKKSKVKPCTFHLTKLDF